MITVGGTSPSYLTLNPDGTIGADFTGIINAKGVILPYDPGGGGITAKNKVQWVDPTNVTWGEIFAGLNGLDARAVADAASDTSSATLSAADDQRHEQATFGVSQSNRGNGQAFATAGNGAIFVKVIDYLQRSNFLQLPASKNLQVQVFRQGGTVSAAGTDTLVALPTAWPNSHLAFFAIAFSTPVLISDIYDNAHGRVQPESGAGGAYATINYISFGN